jgi:hypothetical protein
MSAHADVNLATKWKKRAERLRNSCGSEVQKLCATVPDGKEVFRCILKSYKSELSPTCESYIDTIHAKIAAHKAKEDQNRLPASTPPPASK